MLTVHKLHTNHLILAENDVATIARLNGIEQLLVVIDSGAIVRVHTPPCGMDGFGSDDDWIFTMARDLYARGCSTNPVAACYDPTGHLRLVAPAGWTLWADLKPGTIATSGDPDADAPLVAIGDADFVLHLGRQRFNTERGAFTGIWFGVHHRANPFTFKPHRVHAWPFFKVLRSGLAGHQMRAVVTAVESGEDIEAALANIAPEAT